MVAFPNIWTWLVAALVAAVAVGAAYTIWRQAALRNWRLLATQLCGECKARDTFSPAMIAGTLNGRPYLLETAVSHEDDAPYFHTRGALPLRNRAAFILGLRRKSLLEEAQTRRDAVTFEISDPNFSRKFIIACNNASYLLNILTPELCKALQKYHDVEVYVRLQEIEWRRSGQVGNLKVITELNDVISSLAERIDTLPASSLTLSEKLSDEAVIEKGV